MFEAGLHICFRQGTEYPQLWDDLTEGGEGVRPGPLSVHERGTGATGERSGGTSR